MVREKFAYILLGAPGSGKGTQGELLEKATGFKKYVMSDLIKQELKAKTKDWSKSYDVESGLLLGDLEIFELFRENFKSEKNIILDGIPRTLDQAYWLYGFLVQHRYSMKVIFLDVDETKLLKRILERAKIQGRKDDNEETFKERLQIYDNVKKVILEVYRRDILDIDGDRDIEVIHKDIMNNINN